MINQIGEGTQLCTTSGEPLKHYGEHKLKLDIENIEGLAEVCFQVVSVNSPILSVPQLYDAGHSVDFGTQQLRARHGGTPPLHRMGAPHGSPPDLVGVAWDSRLGRLRPACIA